MKEIIFDTIKTVANATEKTTTALQKIKEIKRTTGISKRQGKRIDLEIEKYFKSADMFSQWCKQNPGYYFEMQIGNMKLSNIESILNLTKKSFDEDGTIPEIELDKEWILKFLDTASESSNYEKQKILSKVLAGELKKPKSISYRTLRILKDLTIDEIMLFKKAISCSFNYHNLYFIPKNNSFLKDFEIMILSECELMDDGYGKSYQSDLDNMYIFTCNKEYALSIKKKNQKINLDCFFFTNSAIELINLLDVQEADLDTIKNYAKTYNNYELSLLKKYNSDKNKYLYMEKNLLSQ